MKNNILTTPGRFMLGANYWTSHAGTNMWADWKPEIVEKDFDQLSSYGLTLLRVFPLWPDFQPLTLLKGCGGAPVEYRMGERPLPDTAAGQAGISEEMMERFIWLADLAEKRGLKLVVGLLTGWMSGRLFVPAAFENRNMLTDADAIQWQVRFVKYFIKRLVDHPAIIAWDLGNECNCMGSVSSRSEAWLWTAAISQAIKAADPGRPIISGMHGLALPPKGAWTIPDQAELTDILTTHPYPPFTPYCDQDPINEIRNGLHATAESVMYASIGGKPCMVEEVGVLGPEHASDKIAADYARTILYSSWAHDLRSLLWWCAYDQDHLDHAPYDWNACERELGLIRSDYTPKKVLAEFKAFNDFLANAPLLPERRRNAVCALTLAQDNWGVAFGSYILAKQAGIELDFRAPNQKLPDCPLYLLPCVKGKSPIHHHRWSELLEKVDQGATLYVSSDAGTFSAFEATFGMSQITKERRSEPARFNSPSIAPDITFSCPASHKTTYTATKATVLATEEDGNPIFTKTDYGKGTIFFLAVPLEQHLSETPGAFHANQSLPWWKIYKMILQNTKIETIVEKTHPSIGVTEHPVNDAKRHVVAINYSSNTVEDTLIVSSGWLLSETTRGTVENNPENKISIAIPANDAVVLTLRRGLK